MSNEIESITTKINDLEHEIKSMEIKREILQMELQMELQIATYQDQISKLELAVQNCRKRFAESLEKKRRLR